ncbi:MAG TPA: TIGR02453 family protein, partial [Gallionellaceae bacterium]|nr:TIGR02453 family protein [Gallionellaceae bacterium]
FRHKLGKDVHAPGFYVHIATDECFFAVGCWHPDSDALGRIRDLIAKKPEKWFSARNDRNFAAQWELSGDSLMRPPRGYDAGHSAIEDLKRKDFVGITPLPIAEVAGSGLVKLAGKRFAATVPFMKFLCEALDVQY